MRSMDAFSRSAVDSILAVSTNFVVPVQESEHQIVSSCRNLILHFALSLAF